MRFAEDGEGDLSLPPGSTLTAPPRAKADTPVMYAFNLPAGSTYLQQDIESRDPEREIWYI